MKKAKIMENTLVFFVFHANCSFNDFYTVLI